MRGKKPWAVAAAALLLIGLAGFAAAGYCNLASYNAPVLTDPATGAEAKATETAGRAKTAQDNFDTTKAAALKEEEAVKSIIAGQAERKNWLEMTHFLFADAVPRPDASNLSPDAKKRYFDDGRGKQAFEDLQKRWKGELGGAGDAAGKPGDDLDPSVDNLIQANIEFFDQRYCDDLAAAWKQIKETAPLVKNDPDALKTYARSLDLDKPPDGRGWIVEVHGSTYHKEADTFLADTLVDNIYRLSVKPGSASTAPTPPPGAPPAPPRGAPPPPPPNGAPPPPNGAPAAPAKTEPASDKDVYLGRVSNVVLFDINSGKRASIVGQSVLDNLLPRTGGSANGMPGTGGTGGPGPAPMGMPGPGQSSNAPSSSPGAPGAPAPGAPAPGAPTTGASGAPAVTIVPRDGWSPLSPFIGAAKSGALGGSSAAGGSLTPPSFGDVGRPKPATSAAAASNHTRTEFVVVFFWKEPLPSDILRGEDPNAKPTPPPTAGPPMGGQPPAMPPMGGQPAAPGDEKPLSPRDLGN